MHTWLPRPGVPASFNCDTGDPTGGTFMEGVPGLAWADAPLSGGRWPVAVTVTMSKCVF